MDDAKALALQRIKDANNVLVTVSSSPSVDQLASAIGLTLLLNKLGKHATAVFSGEVPSTIEFLKPDETLEKTTDSLRDFIIALDKSKADKLRYKVEDMHVKIFITPYRTSISQDDLEFSQGDFNVDAVVALGVREQNDLDAVITAHGRILHDATVISVNTSQASSLGTINWQDAAASSLSEMLAGLGEQLKPGVFDAQMATAFLTGIVAETERFSNAKTSSNTMNISAKLMAAGANQQLVATELQGSHGQNTSAPQPDEPPKDDAGSDDNDDGSLSISHGAHGDNRDGGQGGASGLPHEDETPEPVLGDDRGSNREKVVQPLPSTDGQTDSVLPDTPKIVLEPPALGGTLTANTVPEGPDPTTDPLSLPPVSAPLLDHTPPGNDAASPDVSDILQSVGSLSGDEVAAEPPQPAAADDDQTLAKLEEAVDSPHLDDQPVYTTAEPPSSPDTPADTSNLDAARDAVSQAVAGAPPDATPLEPITALNAQPLDLNLGHDEPPAPPTLAVPKPPTQPEPPAQQEEGQYFDISKLDENTGLPINLVPPDSGLPADRTAASVENPTPPPPVPPPMVPLPPASSEPPIGNILSHGQQPLPNAENDNDAQDPLAPL